MNVVCCASSNLHLYNYAPFSMSTCYILAAQSMCELAEPVALFGRRFPVEPLLPLPPANIALLYARLLAITAIFVRRVARLLSLLCPFSRPPIQLLRADAHARIDGRDAHGLTERLRCARARCGHCWCRHCCNVRLGGGCLQQDGELVRARVCVLYTLSASSPQGIDSHAVQS